MYEALTDKVNFNILRYANCWEDAAVLSEGLQSKPGARILSICSAGDNTFALLLSDPEIVVAADLNPVQLHLFELKKAAITNLDQTEVLQFLGFKPHENRMLFFERIQKDMEEHAAAYWRANPDMIRKGVIHKGKFENYFRIFSLYLLPLIHSRTRTLELLEPKSPADQQAYYDKKWNNLRWKLFFRIFFGRQVMGLLGRDPEFLKNVELNVGNFIFTQAGKQLASVNAQSNFMLRYNLTASFGKLLPDYLLPENFEKIKNNLYRIVTHYGPAETAIDKYGSFDVMNLSNIFEYMDNDQFKQISGKLVEGLEPGGGLVYWNLMIRRRISDHNRNMLFEEALSAKLKPRDRGFFYQDVVIERKI
jgi:S-adenosylmethionine-diacylglycerol 3-amino-3-carboxypropyl transferase